MSDWRDRASCVGLDGEGFFPTGTWQGPNESRQAYAVALRVCIRCPVREQCLDAALAEEGPSSRHNRYGMRGGMTPGQRRAAYEARVEAQRLAELAGLEAAS